MNARVFQSVGYALRCLSWFTPCSMDVDDEQETSTYQGLERDQQGLPSPPAAYNRLGVELHEKEVDIVGRRASSLHCVHVTPRSKRTECIVLTLEYGLNSVTLLSQLFCLSSNVVFLSLTVNTEQLIFAEMQVAE